MTNVEGIAAGQEVSTLQGKDRGRGALRLAFAGAALLLLLTLAAACVKSTATNTPAPSPTRSTSTVAMGTRVETAAGNFVIVHSFLPSIGKAPGKDMVYAAADIEACGGPNVTPGSGVQRTLFDVETPDSRAWPSVAAKKKPQLGPALLQPNKCVRGWVTFSIPKTPKAVYVVLLSSALVKWTIP